MYNKSWNVYHTKKGTGKHNFTRMKISILSQSVCELGKTKSEHGSFFTQNIFLNNVHKRISKIYYLLVLILFAFANNTFSQDYDLIVSAKKDSIACHIDSISGNTIYFEMRYNKQWIHTQYDKSQVLHYKLATINKKDVTFKKGTSLIINPATLPINQIRRNIVFANASYSLYHYTFSLNYERILFVSENAKRTWGYRVGGGIIDNSGKIAIVSFNNLRGKGRDKLEMNIGAAYINEPHSYGNHYISPVLAVGYRRQSTDKRFVLRTGIGVPEGLYLSLGCSF